MPLAPTPWIPAPGQSQGQAFAGMHAPGAPGDQGTDGDDSRFRRHDGRDDHRAAARHATRIPPRLAKRFREFWSRIDGKNSRIRSLPRIRGPG